MKLKTLLFSAICLAQTPTAQAAEGVLIRCGASSGHAFFFKDDTFNPKGPDWAEDGMSNGKIILVKLGDEWDIQFDDAAGSYGYRQDGAEVMLLLSKPEMLTVGAFHSNYVDMYAFDFKEKVVDWSSNKIGPYGPFYDLHASRCYSAGP